MDGGPPPSRGASRQPAPVPAPREAGGLCREGGERHPRGPAPTLHSGACAPGRPPPPLKCTQTRCRTLRGSSGHCPPELGRTKVPPPQAAARGGGRGLPSWGAEQRPPLIWAGAGASAGSGPGRGLRGGPAEGRRVPGCGHMLLRRIRTSTPPPPRPGKGAPDTPARSRGAGP